jgi:hypothetical protein
MSLPMDLRGHVYGRLTVFELAPYTRSVTWKCQCECGQTVNVQANNLRSGHTRSCGCYQEEMKRQHCRTHGATNTPAHAIHSSMMSRCYNPNNSKYSYYGGRGIKVCERWHSFTNFLADMGQPNGKQIDRTCNDGDYTPENCRWVSRKENMRNKRNNHVVEYQGRKMPIAQLAEETGVDAHALYRRINDWNMDTEAAVKSGQTRRRRGINKRKQNTAKQGAVSS